MARDFVQKTQEILQRSGIDPIFGKENLVWAPNWQEHKNGIDPSPRPGSSGKGYAEAVYERLKDVVDESGYDKSKISTRLKEIAILFIQGSW